MDKVKSIAFAEILAYDVTGKTGYLFFIQFFRIEWENRMRKQNEKTLAMSTFVSG